MEIKKSLNRFIISAPIRVASLARFKILLGLLLFFFPIISNTIHAQQLNGIVSYRYILKYGKVASTQKANLYFNNTESVFIHSKGKKGNVTKTEDGKDWDGESFQSEFGGWYQDTVGEVYYKNLKEQKMSFRQFIFGHPYVTEEPKFPLIKWEITTDKKTLGTFACQKAKGRFRGRNYEAWFTFEIPLSNGPWKLQGLPGLILEAYDDLREVQFLFESIEIPMTKPFNIKPATDGKKVDFATYKKADDLEYEKWKRKGESIDTGVRGASITISQPAKKYSIELEYEQ